MAGPKAHQQLIRRLERKDEASDEQKGGAAAPVADGSPPLRNPQARQSEMPISRGGMNQESRAHNKHNRPRPTGRNQRKRGSM